MQVVFRSFNPDDYPVFLKMCREFYASDAVCHSIPESCFKTTFEMCLTESPYVRGYLFESDGIVAGYGLLSFTYSAEVGGLSVLIEELYVLPEFQGKGMIRRFFELLKEEYEDNVSRFRLEVTKENLRAIEIYRRYGFQELPYLQMVKDSVKDK